MTEVFAGDFAVTETLDAATGERVIALVPLVNAPPTPPPPPPSGGSYDADGGPMILPWVTPYTWPNGLHAGNKTYRVHEK